MAWTECCHHDGSFLWMHVGHHRNTAMSHISDGVVAVGLTSSSGNGIAVAASSSMIEEVLAASGVMHQSPKDCIKQARKKTCTEISWERGTSLKRLTGHSYPCKTRGC